MQQVVELNSKPEFVNDLESLLRNYLKNHCSCEMLFGDILISLMEAVQNAMKHGNQFDESKKVRIEMIRKDNEFYLKVSDQGPGFDHQALSCCNPTEEHRIATCNGRGLYLMKSLCHDLNYKNKGRTVVMKFDLRTAQSIAG
jgi:serine/threonine-protein kinase RsbW